MPRVVSYARVSTVKQETDGQSLLNQERAFVRWLAQHGAERVAAYAESKSAKTVEGREQFLRMLADLPVLRPDLVIVDTIDRFSRNLKDGLDLLDRFRSFGIALFPLDWDQPVNLNDDRDWRSVVQELTGADYERRRIRSRVLKYFSSQRARGATTHQRGPFGLRKAGDRLVPIAELARIVRRAEQMYIDGEAREEIVRYIQRFAKIRTLRSVGGVSHFLASPEYVKAGMRSAATQSQIDKRLRRDARRYRKVRHYGHPLTCVFECGVCTAHGVNGNKALLVGKARAPHLMKDYTQLSLQCPKYKKGPHPRSITINEFVAENIFLSILVHLEANSDLPGIARGREIVLERSWEKSLERHLKSAQNAQRKSEADVKRLILELGKSEEELVADVRTALLRNYAELDVLARHREALLGDLLAGLPTKPKASFVWRDALRQGLRDWHSFDHRRKNDFARAFCDALGSRPKLYRSIHRGPNRAWVTWAEVSPDIIWVAQWYHLSGPVEVSVVEGARRPNHFDPIYYRG